MRQRERERESEMRESFGLTRAAFSAGFFPRLTQHSGDDGIKGSSIIRPPNHSTLRLENPRILFFPLPLLPPQSPFSACPSILPSSSQPASLSLSPNPLTRLSFPSPTPLHYTTLTTSSSLTYTMFRVFFSGAHLLSLPRSSFASQRPPSHHPSRPVTILSSSFGSTVNKRTNAEESKVFHPFRFHSTFLVSSPTLQPPLPSPLLLSTSSFSFFAPLRSALWSNQMNFSRS